VNDVVAVGVVERVRHLFGDPEHLIQRQPPGGSEPGPHRFALHVRHDVEGTGNLARGPVRLEHAGVVYREDMRVMELGRELDLAQESLDADLERDLRAEDLDSDLAVVPHIAGEIHHGHPTASQLALEQITIGKSGAECGRRLVSHGQVSRRSFESAPARA
jgi:hypothetical protein